MISKHMAAAMAFAVMAVPATASPFDYTDLFIFGDSLADVGRAFELTGKAIPPTPPYYEGQFTGPDRPVWAEIVGDAFEAEGKDVRNYAVGGAEALGTGLTDMPAQVAQFGIEALLGGVTPGANALAAFWFGANDIFANLPLGRATSAARQAADAITAAAVGLSTFDIDSYLFFTLGDLSLTPAFRGTPFAEAAQAAANAFDSQMSGNVTQLSLLGFDATLLDTGALVGEVVANPSAFGFTNVTEPCVIRDGSIALVDCTSVLGIDASEFLWFDQVHPNSRAHGYIADLVLDEIASPAPVPIPATLPLVTGSIALLFIAGRRKNLTARR